MLATNTAMEVNAATSRMISVMSVSLFLYVSIMFRFCSCVNPKKALPRRELFPGTLHRDK
jgi:hypothetical protein